MTFTLFLAFSQQPDVLPEKNPEPSLHAMQLGKIFESCLAESILSLLSLQFYLLFVNPLSWHSTVQLICTTSHHSEWLQSQQEIWEGF